MSKKIEKVLYDRAVIQERIRELGKELDQRFQGEDILVVSLLRGSFVFAADLVREMKTKMEIDFLTTSSYENEEKSSGKVKILHELRAKVEGRHVLIVDDIVDSGRTLKFVAEFIQEKKPASVSTVVMLDKPSRREVDFDADYVGFTIEDVFIVGYGLDYGSYHRNVPHIFTYEEAE